MPAYNADKYLDKAIKSVLDQSFRDFELIVINDGSHDRTADICRAYITKDARFKFIDKENGGVAAARNDALDIAEGQFVMFVDSDDVIYPYSLQTLYDILVCNKFDYLRFEYKTIDENGNSLLNFGKCQSVHFAAQIASFTLTMMQYNILCTVKRFEAYETIGDLFAEVTNDTLELSVTDKIWAIILDFVLEAAERYSIDATELLADFIESNPVAHTLRNMYIYKQAS